MYTDTIKIKLKCPKHPRFNPLQGEGSIKGNCGECVALNSLFRLIRQLRVSKSMDGEGLEGEFSIKSFGGG